MWDKDLDQDKIPQEKIIKTLIYGIQSSSNQVERKFCEILIEYYQKNSQKLKISSRITFTLTIVSQKKSQPK